MDWSLGSYERTAAAIEPIAVDVVSGSEIAPGDRVLDVGCGTGNAALLAAAAGASVTGVDLAARLIEVARERAEAAGVEATWLVGDAQRLPVDDSDYDVVVSIMGAVFAPDGDAVARELLRVARPGGRIAVTSWMSEGPIYEVGQILRDATAAAAAEPQPEPAAATHWDKPTWAMDLLLQAGAGSVEIIPHAIAFTGASPEDWLGEYASHHPPFLASKTLLESAGTWPATRARLLEMLDEANEDPDAFQVTSHYWVITATKPGELVD